MTVITSLSKTPLQNESTLAFMNRICSIKDDLGMTWKDVATHLNSLLDLRYSESWYRKNYNNGMFEEDVTPNVTTSTDDCEGPCETCNQLSNCLNDWSEDLVSKEADLRELEHKLALKKVQVSDLITQNNAYVRRLSRESTIKEIAYDYAKVMNKDKILQQSPVQFRPSANEGVLLLSDWHYGMVCDNPWNKFDPDICKQRVNTLLNKVINIVTKESINKVNVLDLADLIAGRIHTQIRIESRFDVITQTMQVAEILAEFLNELSSHCFVSFYSCLDNHSRLEPNKKESMDLESLARLIPWYLTERLKHNDSIEICDNKYGADIITCRIAGHNVIGVHGDNDQPRTALERLSLMTHEHYDMLCTAHFHHFSCDENHQTIIVSNSSLMGVDRYAEKLRLTSDPSQTFVVATPENVCECIYRIVLK